VKLSNSKVKIVGSGPLLEQHRQLVKRLDLTNNIEFITGATRAEINQLAANCIALVLPSIYPSEAFAIVQIEAMAAGKPIINTNLKSGVPWVARHMREAITVPPGDTVELSEALVRLESDSDLRLRLSKNAYVRWQNVFSDKMFLDATDSLYSS
jgi:glycosyltransferase involved in cell wall biosynthesis